MANEITLNASLSYSDSEETEVDLAIADALVSVATKLVFHVKHNVATSEEAIKLGDITSIGYALFINRDQTNYVEIRHTTGATNDSIKIPPGKVALFHFGSDASSPVIIANTAACQVEYIICSQ